MISITQGQKVIFVQIAFFLRVFKNHSPLFLGVNQKIKILRKLLLKNSGCMRENICFGHYII